MTAAGMALGPNIVLERELGRGASGVVWLAENRALRAKVAVKITSQPKTEGDQDALARFRREAQLAARLTSPHVVRTYDLGATEEGDPYIVMERLVGQDLRAAIERRGRLSLDETNRLLGQLCQVLLEAHEQGLVHRDIKPSNLYLIDSGDALFLKVLDFGIARVEQSSVGLTQTGAIIGTPYYMSPEQFVNPRSVDHRTDLWAAAVVAYACVLGKLPFLGETVGGLSLAVHSGDFARPSQVDTTLPVALDAFFERALQVDPQNRFGSAAELAAAFDSAVRAGTAHAAPTTAPTDPSPATAPASPAAWSSSHGQSAATPVAPQSSPPHPHAHAGSAQPAMGHPRVDVPTGAPVATSSATQPHQTTSRSRGFWTGLLLAVVGLGALGATLVLSPWFRSPAPDAARGVEHEDAEAEEKPSDEDDAAEDEGSPAQDAPREAVPSASAPSDPEPAAPEPTAKPSPALPAVAPQPTVVPVPPRPPGGQAIVPARPKWRPRNMTCAKFDKSKRCAACCKNGDKLMPYPNCGCYFDGEKWDREHGVSR